MIPKPCYNFQQPNESVLLTQTKVSVRIQGKIYKGDAKVHLDLQPDASIYIRASLPPDVFFKGKTDVEELTIARKKFPVINTGTVFSSMHSNVDATYVLSKEPVTVHGGPRTRIAAVVFHLFNYTNFSHGRRSIEEADNKSHAIQHADLKANGWDIELKSLPSTLETLKTLKETGGYGLTHIGCLQREDRSSFTGKAAEEMLTALRFFLSFSKGMWSKPCLAVGFNNKEDRVWEVWASPGEQFYSPISWFDPQHCEQLVKLFSGFMSRWEDENWREALREVIYWYLNGNCNRRGIDAGIILTQAAIERLSYEYAVKTKRLVTVNGFKELWASDKFRLLLSSLEIPIDIPSHSPELQALSKNFNWLDAPHALTEIRNSLIHPEHKRRRQVNSAFYEAWNLGLWYLELSILRICGYSGSYSNRLINNKYVGTVEDVPWARSPGR